MNEFQVYNSNGKLIKTVTGDYMILYNDDRYEVFKKIGRSIDIDRDELVCVIPKIFIVQTNKKS